MFFLFCDMGYSRILGYGMLEFILGYELSHRTYGSSNSNWYVKFQMFMSARAFLAGKLFLLFFLVLLYFS